MRRSGNRNAAFLEKTEQDTTDYCCFYQEGTYIDKWTDPEDTACVMRKMVLEC